MKPLLNSTKCLGQEKCTLSLPIRAFSSSTARHDAALEQQQNQSPIQTTPAGYMDPTTIFTPRAERKLLRTQHKTPIGSRRQRAALRSSDKVPFEQLPYQCFQEARSILVADRADKTTQIETQRARIARLKATQVSPQDERQKETRLSSMHRKLEELKILADVNDPLVKKRFEDGDGVFLRLCFETLRHSH